MEGRGIGQEEYVRTNMFFVAVKKIDHRFLFDLLSPKSEDGGFSFSGFGRTMNFDLRRSPLCSVRSTDPFMGPTIEDGGFFVSRGRRWKIEDELLFVLRSSGVKIEFEERETIFSKWGLFFVLRLRKNEEPLALSSFFGAKIGSNITPVVDRPFRISKRQEKPS